MTEINQGKSAVIDSKEGITALNRYIPDEEVCTAPKVEDLHFSEMLFQANFGWIFKKKFKYLDLINLTLLRLRSFGVLFNEDTPSGYFKVRN